MKHSNIVNDAYVAYDRSRCGSSHICCCYYEPGEKHWFFWEVDLSDTSTLFTFGRHRSEIDYYCGLQLIFISELLVTTDLRDTSSAQNQKKIGSNFKLEVGLQSIS